MHWVERVLIGVASTDVKSPWAHFETAPFNHSGTSPGPVLQDLRDHHKRDDTVRLSTVHLRRLAAVRSSRTQHSSRREAHVDEHLGQSAPADTSRRSASTQRLTREYRNTASRWYSRNAAWISVKRPTSTARTVGTPILSSELAWATGETRSPPSRWNEMKPRSNR